MSVNVQCILERKNHSDNIYGTGRWDYLQVKTVSDNIAMQLLKHHDVYKKYEEAAASDSQLAQSCHTPTSNVSDENSRTNSFEVVEVNDVDKDRLEEQQLMEQQISVATKKQNVAFIRDNFNIEVDFNIYRSADDVRDYALQLYRQFGLPGD